MKLLHRWLKQKIINEMSSVEKKDLIEEVYGTLHNYDQRDVLKKIMPKNTHLRRNPRPKEKGHEHDKPGIHPESN